MTAPVLSIRSLSVGFGAKTVVSDVSLDVAAGEVAALVGESGSGKSLTARAILSLLPPGGRVTAGDILIEGKSVLGLSPAELQELRGGRVGMIFQDPLAALNPLKRIGEQVAEAVTAHEPSLAKRPRELEARVVSLLAESGLDRAAERLRARPHELSGGQRQRVVIAIAIACRPQVLVADEPTTALDAGLQESVLRLLLTLARRHRMALLLISHDLRLVRRAADVLYVMRRGRILERLDCSAGEADAPKNPYSQLLLRTGEDVWAEDELAAASPGKYAALRAGTLPPLLAARGLTVEYRKAGKGFLSRAGKLTALAPLDLTVGEGETLGVIGESGSGKSTLAMALLRLIASRGEITFRGMRIDGKSFRELRPVRFLMQPIFQDPFSSLNPRLSVRDIVAEGLAANGLARSDEDTDRRVSAALADVGLPADYTRRFPHELSGGERQRVAIARALILEPRLLILDEPTSSLDRALQFQVMELLRDLRRKRALSSIFITHDLSLVRSFAHRVIVLREGRVVEEGFTKDVFSAPSSQYLRQLLNAQSGSGPLSVDTREVIESD
ncbi:nickel ABC transporter ATP-binding protein NikE [Sutterella sp.]|uniref:nickel ABC transporter ATP-binding protein NikE n=1 Tax=Sutterella sp. TaxID=1981025 RepID=UPI0026E06830|nr:nickel ABC transporter ATP-binding protein NikE [Sutterella sp.]MDO5531789.1 nickel ABC transporter ATP-binding protein NikE [Sutterella sp.]